MTLRARQAPFPADVIINGQPYVLAVSRRGLPLWQEGEPREAPPEGQGIQTVLYRPIGPGGLGLREDQGTAESRQTLYFSSALDGSSALETVGGGVDGSWSVLVPGPAMTLDTTSGGTDVIGRFTSFNGKFYAADGAAVLVSTTGKFPSGTTVSTTLASQITDMVVEQLANSAPLLRVAQAKGPQWTLDTAGNWVVDAATLRILAPKAVFKTTDSGATFTDYTAAATDLNLATAADLSNLPTGTGYLYVGFDRPFQRVDITIGLANGTANVMSGAYYNSAGTWTGLTGLVDGTIAAGASLAVTGNITWTRPPGTWVKAPLTASAAALYYVRFTWTANMDASTTITEMTASYRQEEQFYALKGKRMYALSQQNKLSAWDDGGVTPTLIESFDSIGTGTGTALGMVATDDSLVVLRDTDISVLKADGTWQTFPFTAVPVDTTSTAIAAWQNKVYFSRGDAAFMQFDPSDGGMVSLGPERLFQNTSEWQPRIVCVVPDRSHFLYGIAYSDGAQAANAACWSWLVKWGGYMHQRNPMTGIYEWVRNDSWHAIARLGKRKVIGIGTYAVSGQPYLLLGSTTGETLYCTLPVGVSPFEPNSGYKFNTFTNYAYLPTWPGVDAARKLEAHAWILDAENLSATKTVALATKTLAGTSWTTQGTLTSNDGVRQNFTTDALGTGVDVRLALAGDSQSTPPIIHAFGVEYSHLVVPLRQKIECTVLTGSDVRYSGYPPPGRRVPMTATDWQNALDAAMNRTAVAFTRPDGTTGRALVQARIKTHARVKPNDPTLAPAHTLVLVTTDQ